jgi:hypothetical protein
MACNDPLIYWSGLSFVDAPQIYSDADLTTVASDGFYMYGGQVREMVSGVLGPAQPCDQCVIPCGVPFTASGAGGQFRGVTFDFGSAVGATSLLFSPGGGVTAWNVPDQLTSIFPTGVRNSVYSNLVSGYTKGFIGSYRALPAGSDGCRNVGNIPGLNGTTTGNTLLASGTTNGSAGLTLTDSTQDFTATTPPVKLNDVVLATFNSSGNALGRFAYVTDISNAAIGELGIANSSTASGVTYLQQSGTQYEIYETGYLRDNAASFTTGNPPLNYWISAYEGTNWNGNYNNLVARVGAITSPTEINFGSGTSIGGELALAIPGTPYSIASGDAFTNSVIGSNGGSGYGVDWIYGSGSFVDNGLIYFGNLSGNAGGYPLGWTGVTTNNSPLGNQYQSTLLCWNCSQVWSGGTISFECNSGTGLKIPASPYDASQPIAPNLPAAVGDPWPAAGHAQEVQVQVVSVPPGGSTTTLSIEVDAPCSGTWWQILVPCPQPLTAIQSSTRVGDIGVVTTPLVDVCAATITTNFYHVPVEEMSNVLLKYPTKPSSATGANSIYANADSYSEWVNWNVPPSGQPRGVLGLNDYIYEDAYAITPLPAGVYKMRFDPKTPIISGETTNAASATLTDYNVDFVAAGVTVGMIVQDRNTGLTAEIIGTVTTTSFGITDLDGGFATLEQAGTPYKIYASGGEKDWAVEVGVLEYVDVDANGFAYPPEDYAADYPGQAQSTGNRIDGFVKSITLCP